MKKILVRFLAAALAMMLVLSLAACSGGTKGSSAAPASSAAESKPEASSKVESEPASSAAESSSASSTALEDRTEKFASIQEFLDDPTVSAQLGAIIDALGDGMNVDVSADGSRLVYTFTFTQEVNVEEVTAAAQEAMNEESFANTFKDIAGSLTEAIEVENPSVVVTYLAVDGTEIASQEYFPE